MVMHMNMESPSKRNIGLPVYVSVRIRPLLPYDSGQVCFDVPDDGLLQIGLENQMSFHHTFSQTCSQENLYKTCIEPLADSFIEGYNGTVITFGPNSSGKTFTMNGPGLYCAMNESEFGLLPRAIRRIFSKLNEFDGEYFTIGASYLEFYDNQIFDLLNSDNRDTISLTRTANGNLAIMGATLIDCESIENVFSCLEAGLTSHQFRTPIYMDDNVNSTSAFFLTLHQCWNDDEHEQHRYSQLCCIDLGCTDLVDFKDYVEEKCKIGSLSSNFYCNGFKDNMLCSTNNSVVGNILKESFAGNAVTVAICCIEPVADNLASSIFSLHIASLAQSIISEPVINSQPYHLQIVRSDLLLSYDHMQNNCSKQLSEICKDQLFKLKFATTQYQSLVKKAENILCEMTKGSEVREDTLSEIQQWLCMKQECEDCVDECGNKFDINNEESSLRRLDVIEEVTEPSASDMEENQEQYNQLLDTKYKLEAATNLLIETIENDDLVSISDTINDIFCSVKSTVSKIDKSCQQASDSCLSKQCESSQESDSGLSKRAVSDESLKSTFCGSGIPYDQLRKRRSSILPQVNNIVLNMSFKSEGVSNQLVNRQIQSSSLLSSSQNKVEQSISSCSSSKKDVGTSTNLELIAGHHEGGLRTIEKIKHLHNKIDSLKLKIRRSNAEVSCSEQKLQELTDTINLKEGFINDLMKSAKSSDGTKEKIDKKLSRIKLEIQYTKSNCEELQKALTAYQHDSEKQKYLKQKLVEYREKYDSCKKRLGDLQKVEIMSQESDKKIDDLKISLSTMKEEYASIIAHVSEQKARSSRLTEDLKMIEQLVKDYQSKMDGSAAECQDDIYKNDPESKRVRDKQEWLFEEEERILKMRSATEKLEEELHHRQEIIEKRERMVDEKAKLEHKLQEDDGIVTDKEGGTCDESAVRQEIKKLRKTRDSLVTERQVLDHKLYKKRGLSQVEERRLLELDEAIEAIDTAMEYKNEIICSHQQELSSPDDTGLVSRLMNLSPVELRSLLYKYFFKVVDLREESRKLEIQSGDLESQVENLSTYIQDLSAALHRTTLEGERKLVLLQKEYEEKMAVLLRQLNEDSHSSSYRNERRTRELEKDLMHYKKSSRELKKRLRDMLEGNMSFTADDHAALLCPSPNPLKSRLYVPTTKITRERNKIIIQQQRQDQHR